MFLLEKVKLNSDNFDKVNEQATTSASNQAHLFLKLHFWHENRTVSTLTIVDMAGFPLKSKQAQSLPKNHLNAYQDKYSELNS